MRNELQAIVTRLHTVHEKVQGYLDNAESAEYPNDDRIDALTNESDAIGEAIDLLESIE